MTWEQKPSEGRTSLGLGVGCGVSWPRARQAAAQALSGALGLPGSRRRLEWEAGVRPPSQHFHLLHGPSLPLSPCSVDTVAVSKPLSSVTSMPFLTLLGLLGMDPHGEFWGATPTSLPLRFCAEPWASL